MNKNIIKSITNFTYRVYKTNRFNDTDLDYINDMIINSSLYLTTNYEKIIDIYRQEGLNRNIVIIDGLNLSHNYNFIKRYREVIPNIFNDVISCILSEKCGNQAHYFFAENILPVMLPVIRPDMFFLIVISRRETLNDTEYNPVSYDKNYIKCVIDCKGDDNESCYKNYNYNESDDYLIILLYNLLKLEEYTVNGIVSQDNFKWYGKVINKYFLK